MTTHWTGRFLEVRERDGWTYAHRPNVSGVVAVIALAAEGLVLVEQWRPPVRRRVLELPAGLVGDEDAHESREAAAMRELYEETGFSAQRMVHILDGPTSAGMSDEVVAFYRAEGVARVGSGGGVDGEAIEVHTVALANLWAFLGARQAAGVYVDPKIFTAAWLLGAPPPS